MADKSRMFTWLPKKRLFLPSKYDHMFINTIYNHDIVSHVIILQIGTNNVLTEEQKESMELQ
jgi:hypothetical protein